MEKGSHHSEEVKRKISFSRLNQSPHNKGKKAIEYMTPEGLSRIKANLTPKSKEWMHKIQLIPTRTEWRKGKHFSLKNEFKKGLIPWNKGKTIKTDPELFKNTIRSKKSHFYRHGNYKGVLYHNGWDRIRKELKEKANYQCKVKIIKGCSDYLVCHHIDFSFENHSLDNLIICCMKCHHILHKNHLDNFPNNI